MHKPQVLKTDFKKALQYLSSSGETDSNYSSTLFILEHNSNDHVFSLPKYLEILYITFGKFIGMMLLTVIIDNEVGFVCAIYIYMYLASYLTVSFIKLALSHP